jgi:chromate transporter
VLSFLAIAVFSMPFPAVVLAALLTGALLARFAPAALGGGGGGHAPVPEGGRNAALIDDDSATPEHARFKRTRLLRVLLAGALLWALPMAALWLSQGWQHTLTQMGWFFTKAALLTLGGAYAVLPYVNQAAVEHYQWLSTGQMMDGLALGESTPGPLIMVVAFVGFAGGWVKQVAGPDALFLGAALAACVATWFTFLPSFIFVLAGGPWVESTRGNLRLTLPLAAVTAAVVGVIANLALFFWLAVAFPATPAHPQTPWLQPPELLALGLAVLATLALWRLQWSVMRVIGVCALAGLLLRWPGLG